MCTLAIYFRVFPDYPVVVAANRDEYLDRAALPPTVLGDRPRIIGGKDLRASGTWLGINEHGLVAGLLNRRLAESGPNDANLRSRGLLCLDALRHSSAPAAAHFLATQHARDYNAFNLLLASREAAFVAYNRGGEIEIVELTPGMHLLTNADVNDFECPKISVSYDRFAALARDSRDANDPAAMRQALARLLADHTTQLDPRSGVFNSICLHLEGYGTRSSSLIFLGAKPGQVEHFFAEGPPCRTDFKPALIPSADA